MLVAGILVILKCLHSELQKDVFASRVCVDKKSFTLRWRSIPNYLVVLYKKVQSYSKLKLQNLQMKKEFLLVKVGHMNLNVQLYIAGMLILENWID